MKQITTQTWLAKVAGISRLFLRSTEGVAAIEFGFISVIMVMLLVVTTDLSLGFYSHTQVQNAAQAGAQYAALHGYDSAKITAAVTNATSASGVTAMPVPTTFCGCAAAATVTKQSCASTCADGSVAGTYVEVSAARTYTTLLDYPGLAASYAQSSTSTVRIK